ncbi:MAG: ATP-dependent DNA helicase RecQ [Planctomycetota bacterium]
MSDAPGGTEAADIADVSDSVADPIADAVRRVWGYDALRPLQLAAIEAGVGGRDALVVLPTGGGKSLCYQVPPLVTGKVTLVVSPLIALMRDQVRGLELNGYAAAALHSGVEHEEARAIRERLDAGELNLVLAAPERVLTGGFRAMLAQLADKGRLGNIAIDEAHCISQWGHDFRPEYRRLAELREVLPGVAMQAFTATATPRVRDDIAAQLGLVEYESHVGVFDRPNLTYRVSARTNAGDQAAAAIERMHAAGGGGAIVYCLSRKDTEENAAALRARNIDAKAYHAGLSDRERGRVETAFSNESLDVVCATVAFGMGIDRSNVRLVVHATMPKSIEAYQQETGRAGRDGEPAECLLLDSPADGARWERLIDRSDDAESGEAQRHLVREMRRFVSAMGCRHRMLSEHFGQAYTPPEGSASCGACDVCLGETEAEPDAQRVAQIIMSGVARCEQRYGAAHVGDVLRGSRSEKIARCGHDRLSVFGLLKDRRKAEIASYIEQLVAADALRRGEHSVLRFGPVGMDVMKGDHPVLLARPAGTAAASGGTRKRGGSTVDARPLDADEQVFFERLRALRKSIADENGVPPYVVFNDATLRDMARRRPADGEAMLEVKGVGRKKLELFGEAFLACLNGEGESNIAVV